jgi:hypothetical protein
LKSKTGKLIDKVSYNTTWYRDINKDDGGWTLELIDPQNTCSEETNWTASVNPAGGTPGKVNSVITSNPDVSPVQLTSISVESSVRILVELNEKYDSLSLKVTDVFKIDNNISIAAVKAYSNNNKTVELSLNTGLLPRTIYTLTIQNIKDICGNILANPVTTTFSLPEQGDSGDVVINEILFNPKPNGVDFVEIYNRSEKYINLKNWQLARLDDDGKLDDTLIISPKNLVMLPQSYLAITTDGTILKTNYPKGKETNFISTKIPSYNDDNGTVMLFNNKRKQIDKFDYDEHYHFKLLDDREGVSLERIDFNKPGNVADNWHSAAGTEGYATPGYKNSQMMIQNISSIPFSIEPKIFAPDDDGYKDFTTFNYLFSNPGNVATIKIFDSNGRLVKNLIQNQSLSTEGTFQWDGTNDRNEKVRIGMYLVFMQVFEMGGREQTFKETVAVVAK